MDMPKIMIAFTIKDELGKTIHEGRFNYTDMAERRACAERFNQCLLDGYIVTTKRVK